MEGRSSIERVVGAHNEAEHGRILAEEAEIFNAQAFEDLSGKERLKTKEEITIIGLANRATNELRARHGFAPLDIPPDNIHLIKGSAWPEGESMAFYDPLCQAVAIHEDPSRMRFAK